MQYAGAWCAPVHVNLSNPMKLRFLPAYLATVAIIFVLFCPAAMAAAVREKDPEIQHIVVTTAEGVLRLSASIHGALTRTLLKELRDGNTLTFVFSAELVRKDSGWFGASLNRSSITHTLWYDKEKEEYVFITPDTKDNPRRTHSLTQAGQWLSTFSHIPVAELSSLVADAPYAIHMQAVLKQGLLPFNLGRFVPIWQISGIQTDRRTIEFRY